MNPRTSDILIAAIREFIESGEPVSSGELYGRHQFPVKPATIRNELADLDEAGYLVQPHTSAGRVPTDKGYVFFVETVLRELADFPHARMPHRMGVMYAEFFRGAFDDLVSYLAEELRVLGVGYETGGGAIYKSGLDDLVEELVAEGELSRISEITDIIKDFEAMDERVNALRHFIAKNGAPQVFVGRSPITKSPHLSVIADAFRIGDGETFVVAAVGPRRMDYEENLRFFVNLRRMVEER